jgi:hypothetical protein
LLDSIGKWCSRTEAKPAEEFLQWRRDKLHKVKLSTLVILLCFFVAAVAAPQTNFTRQQYDEDFEFLWRSISDDYAYFDQKQTDWNKVREIYRPHI